jgi:hypothetical protein
VARGDLRADTPEERRNVRRLESMLAALASEVHTYSPPSQLETVVKRRLARS